MKTIVLMLAMATAGCASIQTEEPQPAPPGEGAMCDAAPAQSLIGRSASDDLLEEGKRLSGAEIARFLRPGQVVTLEYRADRLNLHLDAKDVVESVNCG